mgnify:CR=1 FL=1
MDHKKLKTQIQDRINELKSEQIGLRLFIQSDQNLWDALERAINELYWVLGQLESED